MSSAQVEARTLCEQHVGMRVTSTTCFSSAVVGTVVHHRHAVMVWPPGRGVPISLKPTDLVTLTGGGSSS